MKEHDHGKVFWALFAMITVVFIINVYKCNAMETDSVAIDSVNVDSLRVLNVKPKPFDGYFELSGGWGQDELAFAANAIGILGPIAGRFQYFYSNPTEVFSLGIGPVADISESVKVILTFGTELNNDFEPKVSLHSHVRVVDGINISFGGESVADSLYASLGLVIRLDGLSMGEPKPKRFF